MIAKGWRRTNSQINLIDYEGDEGTYEPALNNRSDYVYSINSTLSRNPFFLTSSFFGIVRDCLIDTGADISIINGNVIP
jgi:hypothetical protein